MSPRIQVSNKRKSTSNHSLAEESTRIEDGDIDTSSEEKEEAFHARSRVSQGRPATSASTILVQVMRANQKTPPPAAAATFPTRGASTTASLGSSIRARALEYPQGHTARSNTSVQTTQNIPIQNHASPPACLTLCFFPNACCISTGGHATSPPHAKCWSKAVCSSSYCC